MVKGGNGSRCIVHRIWTMFSEIACQRPVLGVIKLAFLLMFYLLISALLTQVYEHINEKYYMNYTGLVQVYQKPDPDNLWKPTAKQQANWDSILRVQVKGMNWDQSQEKYEKWHGEAFAEGKSPCTHAHTDSHTRTHGPYWP